MPDLDAYCSFIAGYASSATRLERRPTTELWAALPKLRKSFFEACPEYKRLANYITNTETPALFHELEVADNLRFGLVRLIARLLSAL